MRAQALLDVLVTFVATVGMNHPNLRHSSPSEVYSHAVDYLIYILSNHARSPTLQRGVFSSGYCHYAQGVGGTVAGVFPVALRIICFVSPGASSFRCWVRHAFVETRPRQAAARQARHAKGGGGAHRLEVRRFLAGDDVPPQWWLHQLPDGVVEVSFLVFVCVATHCNCDHRPYAADGPCT